MRAEWEALLGSELAGAQVSWLMAGSMAACLLLRSVDEQLQSVAGSWAGARPLHAPGGQTWAGYCELMNLLLCSHLQGCCKLALACVPAG